MSIDEMLGVNLEPSNTTDVRDPIIDHERDDPDRGLQPASKEAGHHK